ncbi:MAG: hypothetical protein L0G63_02095 [Psychrobacter sp.]|nr:hypothetical protein [Psychrobacter sp.]
MKKVTQAVKTKTQNQCLSTTKEASRLEHKKMAKAYGKSHTKMARIQAESQYLAGLPTQADTLSFLTDCPLTSVAQAHLEAVVPELIAASKRKATEDEYQKLATFLSFCAVMYLHGNKRQYQAYSKIPMQRIYEYLCEQEVDEAVDIGLLPIR